MTRFTIVSQTDTTAAHRLSRGIDPYDQPEHEQARKSTVTASDIAQALALAADSAEHRHRRIVSVEETHPGLNMPSDEELTEAFTDPARNPNYDEPIFDTEDFDDDEKIYAGGEFSHLAQQVADALRDTGLVPGLHLSLLYGDGIIEYAMVEIRDEALNCYRSRGSELKHLTDDRSATGWQGLLALARGLIDAAQELH